MGTFKARGTGGAEFEFDDLEPDTIRGEHLAGQIRRGELVVLDKKGDPIADDARTEFLAPFAAELDGTVVGEPIIQGSTPAVPVDPDVDPNRPQIGDAIWAPEPVAPPAAVEPAGDADGIAAPDAPDDDTTSNGLPEGPAAAIVDWVRGAPDGDDPTDGWEDRARNALEVEQAKAKPGKGLVTKLEEIVAQADAPDDDTTTS